MSDRDGDECQPGVGRVEAFSDGVIAIIITIMVLELKAPEEPGLAHLWRLWPTFLAYVLSFAYVGIYWVNHHRLVSHARRVTNGLVWYNLVLLFALSLVPFSTAYLGGQHFSRDATLVYLASMLLPSLCYVPLQRVIRLTGTQSEAAQRYHRQDRAQGGGGDFALSRRGAANPHLAVAGGSPLLGALRCSGSCPTARSTPCSTAERTKDRPDNVPPATIVLDSIA